MIYPLPRVLLVLAVAMGLLSPSLSHACTGITLRAADGAVVQGRTMEWGSFDMKSRLVIIPRGHAFTTRMPDGKAGLSWTGKYGVVGLDAVDQDIIVDGMNEQGMSVGLYYLPGFAEYQPYEPAKAAQSMGPTDIGQYLLSSCATVEEVRAAISKVRVVAVVEPALGFPAPVHFLATDSSGKGIVIEYLHGELKIFDAPLGVITNAPSYDWHETNLRNYINLSAFPAPGKKIDGMDLKPLGGGSGMLGLPGDFTPPSRFVRAVAFTQTARPTKTGDETRYELFRILDNFNVPLGAAEGSGTEQTQGLRSDTAWTTAYDLKNKIVYYHTQNNRRVRRIELNKIDFAKPGGLIHQPLDKVKAEDIEDRTPTKA